MFEQTRFGKTHVAPAQRLRLQEAILSNDPALFREILQESLPPETDDRFRLYGVLTLTEQGMVPILVDQTGERYEGPDAVIPAETPIDMLNVEYFPHEIVATIGGEVYRAPVEVKGLQQEPPGSG